MNNTVDQPVEGISTRKEFLYDTKEDFVEYIQSCKDSLPAIEEYHFYMTQSLLDILEKYKPIELEYGKIILKTISELCANTFFFIDNSIKDVNGLKKIIYNPIKEKDILKQVCSNTDYRYWVRTSGTNKFIFAYGSDNYYRIYEMDGDQIVGNIRISIDKDFFLDTVTDLLGIIKLYSL